MQSAIVSLKYCNLSPEHPNMSLYIKSINVKGLNSPFKRNVFWKEAISQDADILCIQETHFTNTKPPSCTHKKYSHYLFSNAVKKKCGVMIAISAKVSFVLNHIEKDGKFIILSAIIDNLPLTLVNIYAPNISQRKFYEKLGNKIGQYKNTPLINRPI